MSTLFRINLIVSVCYCLLILGSQLFESDSFQHATNFSLDPLPYRMDVTVTGAITFRRVHNTSVRDYRSFDRFDHFQQGNILRGSSKHEAATGAPERLD
jgi:hypothetical protein